MSPASCDLIVVGTGPAGLTAGLYGARLGLATTVFGDTPGGGTTMIGSLDNFPGFPEGISGTLFGVQCFQQAQAQGAQFPMRRLRSVTTAANGFLAEDLNGDQTTAPCAVIATGRIPRRLAVPGASLPGIHFCSLCDGPLFRGTDAVLAVIGDDNTAAQHAATLARIAHQVLLITSRTKCRMDDHERNLLCRQDNIRILTATTVTAFTGTAAVSGITVQKATGVEQTIDVNGIFLAIGWRPNLKMLTIPVDRDREGYLITDRQLMTSHPGLFAAGDVRDSDMRQVLTACADGARAARNTAAYLTRATQPRP